MAVARASVADIRPDHESLAEYYIILSFYQHYVVAINRYYAILSVFAKITLYRYNVKTDIT